MLQEGLVSDKIQAVNHYVIEQQLGNRKFIHESMTITRLPCQHSADSTHCLETPVEYNITDSILNKEAFFLSNLPILLSSEPVEKTSLRNCLLLDTHPLLLERRWGEGEYGYFLELHIYDSTKFW